MAGFPEIEYIEEVVTVGGMEITESLSDDDAILMPIDSSLSDEDSSDDEHCSGGNDHSYHKVASPALIQSTPVAADLDVYEFVDETPSSSGASSAKRPRFSFFEPGHDSESDHGSFADELENGDEETEHCSDKKAKKMKKKTAKRLVIPLNQLIERKCCGKNGCLAKINIDDASMARDIFQNKSLFDQQKYVMETIAQQIFSGSSKGKVKTKCKFLIGHEMVCQEAWILIIGMARATFYRAKEDIKKGKMNALPRNFGRKGQQMPKTKRAINWIKNFAMQRSDYMPDSGRICLPSSYTKAKVYLVYKNEVGQGFEVAESQFYTMWRKHLSFITIPKTMRFAKCTLCENFIEQLQRLPPEQKNALKDTMKAHHKQQMDERQNYYRHRKLGRMYPDECISIIIDGMDQKKTDIPHFAQMTKSTANFETVTVHVTGVLVHGAGSYAFLDYGQFGRGANLVAAVLLSTLEILRGKRNGSLPKILYLQVMLMDNAAENKNSYLMALLCYLVELEVFDEIEVSFLIVGHTHEDIDQLFSCISRYLKKNNALTSPQLMKCITESCSTPHPDCRVVDAVYNVKEWLIPCMQPIKGITGPHIFRFHRNDVDKAVLTYKEYSTDQEWLPCELTDAASPFVLKQHPALDTIRHVDIDYSKLGLESNEQDNTKGIKNSLPDYEKRFQYIDKSAITWWQNFIDDISSREEEPTSPEPFVLSRLLPNSLPMPPLPEQSAQVEQRPPMKPLTLGRGTRKFHFKERLSEDIGLVYQIGKLVLLDCRSLGEGYQDWPHVAEITEINSESVTILWYSERKGSKFAVYKERVAGTGRGRKAVSLTNKISKAMVISDGFALTPKDKLPQCARTALSKYHDGHQRFVPPVSGGAVAAH